MLSQEEYKKMLGEVSQGIGYTERLSSPVISLLERNGDETKRESLPGTREDLRRYLLACKRNEDVRRKQETENVSVSENEILEKQRGGVSKYYAETFLKSLKNNRDRFLVSCHYFSGLSSRNIEKLGIIGVGYRQITNILRSIDREYLKFLERDGVLLSSLDNSLLWETVTQNGETYYNYGDGEVDTTVNIAPLRKAKREKNETEKQKLLDKFKLSSRLSLQKHCRFHCQGPTSPLTETGERDLTPYVLKSKETLLYNRDGRCKISLGTATKTDYHNILERQDRIKRELALVNAYQRRTETLSDIIPETERERLYETYETEETIETVRLGYGESKERQRKGAAIALRNKKQKQETKRETAKQETRLRKQETEETETETETEEIRELEF